MTPIIYSGLNVKLLTLSFPPLLGRIDFSRSTSASLTIHLLPLSLRQNVWCRQDSVSTQLLSCSRTNESLVCLESKQASPWQKNRKQNQHERTGYFIETNFTAKPCVSDPVIPFKVVSFCHLLPPRFYFLLVFILPPNHAWIKTWDTRCKKWRAMDWVAGQILILRTRVRSRKRRWSHL